jgi:AcrR family transcriptional regulator
VPEPVKTRPYAGARRREAADARRRRVVEAAAELFTSQGYAATSMAAVASAAGVALDTVYASVGRKPAVLLAAHDLLLGEGELGEDGRPVGAEQRGYVAAVRAAEGAQAKISTYADALARVLPRTAPLLEALREAGTEDAECRATWESLQHRRAANMRLFVADLRATGEMRADVDDDTAADLIWSMNDSAWFTALASRGRSPQEYAALVTEVWSRTLLRTG